MKASKSPRITIVAAVSVSCAWAIADAQREGKVDYPSGYRAWMHVKTMIIQPGHPLEDPFGGIHHVYANEQAMNGLRGGKYTNGAIFVFDLLDYEESNNLVLEKERKRIDVMQYDRQLFSQTGGWGFGTFVGNSRTQRVKQDVVSACYGCHESAKETNYVYSQYRP